MRMDKVKIIKSVKEIDFLDSVFIIKNKKQINTSIFLALTVYIVQKNISKKNLIILTPESEKFSLIFTYLYTVMDIYNENIKNNYSYDNLIKNEKYKFQNSIVKFNELNTSKEKQMIKVELSDGSFWSLPTSKAPFFQKVDTNRNLSSLEKFKKDFNVWKQKNNSDYVQKILNLKTHLKQSNILYSDKKMEEYLLNDLYLDGEEFKNLLLTGKIVNGDVKKQVSGQYEGNPSLILSRDIDEIQDYIFNNQNISKIFLSFKNRESLEKNLQYVDFINQVHLSNVIFTESLNDNQFKLYKDRNYVIWSWKKNLIREFYNQSESLDQIGESFKAFSQSNLSLIKVDYHDISHSVTLLKRIESKVDTASPYLVKIFDRLVPVIFSLLRNYLTVSVKEQDIEEMLKTLNDQNFIDDIELINQLQELLVTIKNLVNQHNTNGKKAFFSTPKNLKISGDINTYFVIDSKQNYEFTEVWLNSRGVNLNHHRLNLIEINELDSINHSHSRVYLPFWLNHEKMHKIIHSYNIRELYLMLYEPEFEWANAYIKKWEAQKKSYNDNNHIFKELFNTILEPDYKISEINEKNEIHDVDIDQVLSSAKIRRFSDYSNSLEEFVNVIPIDLSHEKIFLSAENHKFLVISSTDIQETKVKNKKIEDLSPGEFIVLRNSEKDLIREYADRLLSQDNQSDLRNLAESWKTPFRSLIEAYSLNEIYSMYAKKKGKRHKLSIKNWLSDENMIGPKYIEDLEIINEMCNLDNDPVQMHKAIQIVDQYHVKAGTELSKLLENTIKSGSDTETFLYQLRRSHYKEMNLSEIGNIMFLKVHAIGEIIKVPKSKVNSLIEDTYYG